MDTVKVAVRIRPLVTSEVDLGCKPCVHRIVNEPQVSIGKANQLFTYNYVFDESEGQNKVYNVAVQSLIDNLFKGYNLTILAYGQTGSGKTYTMGTNYSGEGELGVIPRAIYDIFEKMKTIYDQDFRLTVSFIELYNESLYDLLTQRPREQSIVDLREQGNGICIPGLTEMEVSSPEETLERLRDGSLGRVVGSTAMNAQSSRSHAIFTINIKIIPKEKTNEIMTSKFHLVDLAGSERSKKTGATGDRFKEGVNINKGLLNLGNVISQLGEGNCGFINYRDSKLTRLLLDSLGGNSVTLMIACISPADYNQDETISTLRYADRARKIKNKPIVNQDPRLAELIQLRKENEELRLQILGEGKAFGCPPEHKVLQIQLSDSQKMANQLSKALSEVLSQNATMHEKVLSIENAETTLKEKLSEIMSLSASASGDDPILKELKAKLSEVEAQQKIYENEILSFDKNAENEADENEEDLDRDDAVQNGQISERRNEHILSQSKINKELLALTKNLTCKEELVVKLTASTGQLDQMQGVTLESISSLKQELAELQQEREELLKQIRLNSNSQNSSAKIAETRRKRLQELETKVSSLMKKVQEQERIIKMKEKSDEKIISLRQEILSMKQMKVKLIQQMKSENEKFKVFKAQKDREVCQLRTQNQKRQNQLKKMEQMHTSQQNVLRRKLEASAAANKRLMAALERQKEARNKKYKGFSNDIIKERINEEIELLESAYEAQKSLENLLQDRAALNKELGVIKESLVDENVSEQEKVKLRIDMKQIEQELEYRSAEISDLQQKLLDIHQDDRNRIHWESLHSMADAKCALNHLFNLASEKVKDILDKSNLLAELKEQQVEMEQKLNDYCTKFENTETFYKKALEKMEKECEEKVFLFMKLATENSENSKDPELSVFSTQFKELVEKCDQLRNRIKELEEEIETLSNNRTETTTALDPFQKFLEERNLNTTFVLPEKKKGKVSKQSSKIDIFAVVDEETMKALDSSQEFDEDDTDKDPDWRNTPIHKRLKALKNDNNRLGKRMGDCGSEKCDCSSRCGISCPCSKASSPCNENCACDRSKCPLKKKKPRFSSRIDILSETTMKKDSDNEMEADT